jgi:hypothetical protein
MRRQCFVAAGTRLPYLALKKIMWRRKLVVSVNSAVHSLEFRDLVEEILFSAALAR